MSFPLVAMALFSAFGNATDALVVLGNVPAADRDALVRTISAQIRATVETAVAIAGGFTPRAERNTVQISRSAGGQPTRWSVPTAMPR